MNNTVITLSSEAEGKQTDATYKQYPLAGEGWRPT